MISVFGYNLGLVLDYPSGEQNYTFSTIPLSNLLEKLEAKDFRENQVIYIPCRPNKAFTDLCKYVLTDEKLTQFHLSIHCVFESEHHYREGFKKLTRKFKKKAAAGGLVQNAEGAFLAIFSRGRWCLPKGGIEPDESPQEAAVRDVEEETGLLLPTVIGGLPNSYHVFPHKNSHILKTTYWFLMHVEGNPTLIPQDDEGIEEVRWFSYEEWINEDPPSYPQVKAYLQQYFSQQLVGE
jgi:8-oxo-dGTP pyrophosphatase MutT (NUDIX family)